MATNLEFIKSASGTASTLDVTDLFSDRYDVYKIVIPTFSRTTANWNLEMRLLNSSGTPITTLYDNAGLIMVSYGAFGEHRNPNNDCFDVIGYNTTDVGFGAVMYIYNPYDSSSYTFLQQQSLGWVNGSGLAGYKVIGVHKSAQQITGVQFGIYQSAGIMNNIEVSVYGVK